ncbi:MAG TPA: DinB family protein [Chloroflexia bacterium]|nr:DinB family protein [Chloroflexia bacterium]
MLAELQGVQETLDGLTAQVKKQLEGLDENGLNWVPAGEEEVNSLYATTLHIALAQIAVAGRAINQRLPVNAPEVEEASSVFKVRGVSADRAYELLDEATLLVRDVLNRLTPEILDETRVSRSGESHTARWWILHLIEHTANHLGHMELTRQLYLSQKDR